MSYTVYPKTSSDSVFLYDGSSQSNKNNELNDKINTINSIQEYHFTQSDNITLEKNIINKIYIDSSDITLTVDIPTNDLYYIVLITSSSIDNSTISFLNTIFVNNLVISPDSHYEISILDNNGIWIES